MFKLGTGALCLAALITVSFAYLDRHENRGEVFAARHVPSGWTTPLDDLGIDGTVRGLASPRDWAVKQVSSYDRTGGNNDDAFGHQVFDGGVVLADLQGPGSVMRIWTRNPTGTVFIYVDDMEHPLITAPFRDLFTGDLELFSPGFNLFAPPFSGEGSGGYFSYVPIPYAERCRIVVMGEEDVLSYQVSYAEFAPGTPIRSFELTLNKDDVKYFRNWRDAWLDTDMKYHNRKTEKIHQSSSIIWPQSNVLVYPIEGPGVITELEMSIDSFDPEHFQKVWLAIYFDGQTEPGVLAPIGDFFGTTSVDSAEYDGLVMGNLDGRMWCRYPMPFKSFAEIRVLNVSDVMADFKYSIIWKPGPVDDQRYFYARYNSGDSSSGSKYTVADLRGSGHFAGCTITARDANSLQVLEGDDVFVVDGQPMSAYHGTGTDDYFNGGSYFATGPFSSTLHACTLKVAQTPTGFSAFRNHVTEPVPFSSSLRFEIEQNEDVKYSSVAYWYQAEKNASMWRIAEVSTARNLNR